MLDELRFEFKFKNGMEFQENNAYKKSKEFINSIINTHNTLAVNGNNALVISLDKFPEQI